MLRGVLVKVLQTYRTIWLCIHVSFIYFKELANVAVEAGRSSVCRIGPGPREELMWRFKSSSLLHFVLFVPIIQAGSAPAVTAHLCSSHLPSSGSMCCTALVSLWNDCPVTPSVFSPKHPCSVFYNVDRLIDLQVSLPFCLTIPSIHLSPFAFHYKQ